MIQVVRATVVQVLAAVVLEEVAVIVEQEALMNHMYHHISVTKGQV